MCNYDKKGMQSIRDIQEIKVKESKLYDITYKRREKEKEQRTSESIRKQLIKWQ